MKVVWAHDVVLQEDSLDGKVYSQVEFPYENWLRYLSGFQEVRVMTRGVGIAEGEQPEGSLTSGPNVSFSLLPNVNGSEITAIPKVMRRIRATVESADALIARLPSTIGLLAIREAKRAGIPYAVEAVGCPADALPALGTFKGKLAGPLMASGMRRAVKGADRVLYVTERFLQERYPTRAPSVSCSNVKLRLWERETAYLPWNGNEPVKIGLIGFLSRYKGIDTAILALARLQKEIGPVELHILGAGDQEPWLELADRTGLGREHVQICVLHEPSDVAGWLDSLHLYIQPSRTEGLPRGLIEAMSRELPCVAARVGGIPELIGEEFLIEVGDDEKLAGLLEGLLNNPATTTQIGKANRVRALDYRMDRLEPRRTAFWKDFADDIARRQS